MTTDRTFDRFPHFDHRSRQFPIRALLDTTVPRSYTWRCDHWLDQGREGACVGFAWTHELAARPTPIPSVATSAFARGVYKVAQTVDEWDGEVYEGTSVLAGAKVVKDAGYMSEYRWAFGLTDALAGISRHGPGVAGLNWHEGMFDPDADGYLHPTGGVAGGHAILVTGVNVTGRYVTVHNSWGPSWGQNGRARITWDDFGGLLADDGELCLPVRRARPAT